MQAAPLPRGHVVSPSVSVDAQDQSQSPTTDIAQAQSIRLSYLPRLNTRVSLLPFADLAVNTASTVMVGCHPGGPP